MGVRGQANGKESALRWVVQDRSGNTIYLTRERWDHILEYHDELENHLEDVLKAIQVGRRKQDAMDPCKYKYQRYCADLLPEYNHIVVVVIFKKRVDESGLFVANNFVLSAWGVFIHPKG